MVRKRKKGFTPIGNDPYKPAGMDSRNGEVKVMDRDGNVKYIVPNKGQFQQGPRTFIKRARR